MSKLATILGRLGSRHRRVVGCLLSFIVATVIGTLLFCRPYFVMSIAAVVAVSQYLFLPKIEARKFTDLKF